MPLHLRVDLPDGPGALAQVTKALAAADADVLSVHVVDRAGGLIKEEGFSLEEIRQLFLQREGNALTAPDLLSFDEVNQRILDDGVDEGHRLWPEVAPAVLPLVVLLGEDHADQA